MFVPELTIQQLKIWLKENKDFILVDVREDWEREICAIPNDIHIPLAQIPQTNFSAWKEKPIVVYCKAGGRSAMAVQFLQEQGFTDSYNLKGGMDAYSLS